MEELSFFKNEFSIQRSDKMSYSKPKQIKVTIYPNQLEWIERIAESLNQSRRQTFLECFACYIGEFKQAIRERSMGNEK